jgi:hypothetical protein
MRGRIRRRQHRTHPFADDLVVSHYDGTERLVAPRDRSLPHFECQRHEPSALRRRSLGVRPREGA